LLPPPAEKDGREAMRIRTLAGALVLAAALAGPTLAEAGHRHSRHCGHVYRPSPRHAYVYEHDRGYAHPRYGYHRSGYRPYWAPRPVPYGYGHAPYGYAPDAYSYSAPPPRYHYRRPRGGFYLDFGFRIGF
jgi:hypothetical protein